MDTEEKADLEQKIISLVERVEALESDKKDIWDKLNIIGSLLLPVAIASITVAFSFVELRVNQSNNNNQQELEEKRNASDRAIASIDADASKRQADVSQGQTISDLIEPLLKNDSPEQKLAIEAVRIALKPEDASNLLNLLSSLQPETQPILLEAARQAEEDAQAQRIQEIQRLVDQIFGPDRNLRRAATSQLTELDKRPLDESLVPMLLDTVRREPDNYFGIVNTLFILSKVEDSPFQANSQQIRELVDSARGLLSPDDKQTYVTPLENRLN